MPLKLSENKVSKNIDFIFKTYAALKSTHINILMHATRPLVGHILSFNMSTHSKLVMHTIFLQILATYSPICIALLANQKFQFLSYPRLLRFQLPMATNANLLGRLTSCVCVG